MAKVNSKQKGSKNERKLSKLFEKWTGKEFTRTPGSGGLRWSKTDDTIGDIICSDQKHSRYFRFVIEAKSYKEINFEQLILPNKNKKILEFWDQVLGDSIRSGKIPLLFMRYNGMPKDFHFVVMDYNMYMSVFRTELEKLPKNIRKAFRIVIPRYDLIITTTEMLFNTDYEKIHKLAKKFLKNEKK